MEPATATAATTTTPASMGLRYGLLTGLVSIILSFVFLTAGLQENWEIRLLSTVVVVVGIVLAQREFKKQNAGFMSYGQGLTVAVVTGIVVGVLGAVFTYVYMGIIAPDTLQAMLDKTRAGMEAKGNLTDEQIDQGMALTAKFMTPPIMAVMVVFVSVIQALIIGLISSAFVKHTKPEFE